MGEIWGPGREVLGEAHSRSAQSLLPSQGGRARKVGLTPLRRAPAHPDPHVRGATPGLQGPPVSGRHPWVCRAAAQGSLVCKVGTMVRYLRAVGKVTRTQGAPLRVSCLLGGRGRTGP